MQRFVLLILGVLGVHSTVIRPNEDIACGYNACPRIKEDFLNVHIVPHTHDDVGWLKTVDQYYYGSRNSIQKAGVQYILDSVIKELWEDPKRRFIYVETAFFWKWWVLQTDAVQLKVHKLVNQGRLQFVGGAWSMNDEAASHYQSTIDQFTWGLSKLNKTFGYCGLPRVGWQIDPFGHSREFASLLSMMGYDGLFLGRIDYQDKRHRLITKSMEMLWRGNDVLGESTDIFTGVLHNTYSPPPGFCFDVLCNDEPIIDDPNSPMYNVDDKVEMFLDYIMNHQRRYYLTKNVILTMGGDFTYQDATMWYTNLDKLIKYTNLKSAKDGLNITLYYSTPNCYLKAIHDANPTLPTKKDDFFPYASDATAYWTGYFTSRPTTKYFEREANNYLQMVKQLQVLTALDKHNEFVLDELKSAMGIMQHHDAITGTEKQHVTHDYERILNQGIDDAMIISKQAFNILTQEDSTKPPILDFKRCHLNESKCEVSERADNFIVTIYNPLAWTVREPIRIPVVDSTYDLFGNDGKKIQIQMVQIAEMVKTIPTRGSKAQYEIVFITEIKALSYKSFYAQRKPRQKKSVDGPIHIYLAENLEVITPKPKKNINDIFEMDGEFHDDLDMQSDERNEYNAIKKPKDVFKNFDSATSLPLSKLNPDELRMLSDEPRIVERHEDDFYDNQHFRLDVEPENGNMNIVAIEHEDKFKLTANMYYYRGSDGDNVESRASGAYIFRPKTLIPTKLHFVESDVIDGEIVKEFRVYLSPNGYMATKIYKGLNFIENEYIAGPIPVNDANGKEYVIKYESNIFNHGEFFTDSNGRQMLKRNLNYRPQWNVTIAEPIAGNYYPVTNEINIKNENVKLTVLTDRSAGGSSLLEGEIELMVHRRLLHDDGFGVGEALNETAQGTGLVVRGKHRILVSNPNENMRKHSIEVHMPPHVLFSDAKHLKLNDWVKLNNEFSFVDHDFPNGIHLLTLEPWDDKLLIRFENYLNTDPVEIDFTKLFKNIIILDAKETLLAANVWSDSYNQWSWNNQTYKVQNPIDNILKFTIKANEIKTFIVEYRMKNSK